MMKKPVKKKDSLASRARAKALEDSMKAAPTRRAMASDKPPMAPPAAMPKGGAPAAMATPPDMSASPGMAAPGGMAPPGGAPMGMKRGGAVKKGAMMSKGGKTPPKKGGLMVMIAMGKKKGR